MRNICTASVTNSNLMRVVLAVMMALPLGCSSEPSSEAGTNRGAPLEIPETLRITVRNTTDQTQYVDNPGLWMRSASEQVANFHGGYTPPPVVPALYTNQPTCQGIRSGQWACGQHGDTAFMVRALAPGADYSEEWNAQVWQPSRLDGDPDCGCAEPVKAPAGDYLVSFGVSSSVTCSDSACACEPGDGSCVGFATVLDPVLIERPVTWPAQGEVLLIIE